MRECFCFGSEAVNASGEAVRKLVKSRVGTSLAASPLANSARNHDGRSAAARPLTHPASYAGYAYTRYLFLALGDIFRKIVTNHKARKKLANQKWIHRSVYPCGISEQAFESRCADGLYRGFCDTSGCNAGFTTGEESRFFWRSGDNSFLEGHFQKILKPSCVVLCGSCIIMP